MTDRPLKSGTWKREGPRMGSILSICDMKQGPGYCDHSSNESGARQGWSAHVQMQTCSAGHVFLAKSPIVKAFEIL